MVDSIFLQNGLRDEELSRFKQEFQALKLDKGFHFVTFGQVSRDLALIERGYLRTYHIDDKGNEITTEFNRPETFCSSFYSFYTELPSFEFIQAITDCTLYLISFHSLNKLYADSFQVNAFARRILQQSCIERDLRLKKILHLPAKEKYSWFMREYSDVYQVASLSSIASFLGMKQETLSRVRRNVH